MAGLGSAAARPQPFDTGPLQLERPRGGLGAAAAASPFDAMYAAPPTPPPFAGEAAGVEANLNPSGSYGLGAAAAVDMARLDQALAEDAQRSAAAAEGPAGQGAPPSALQSALGEREGELGAIYDTLANERFRTVTTANQLFPIVQRDAQNFYGGGPLELQPFTPPPPEPGEDEWAYMQRVQQLQDEDVQRQLAEAQTLGDVRDIGKSGHLGMREAQIQAAEGVGEAEVAQQERVAETMRQTAELSAKATADARAADQERRDFAMAQRDAIAQAQAVQADARERLQALPELDDNRTFKSMDGGNMFWAIVGSLAGGAIGANQVPGQLMELAARSLETQKANAAQAFDAAAVADAGVAQQTGLYRELLDAAGDEAAADAMFLQLQLEDAERMLQAQLAETTVPALRAQIQESMVGLRQQIDAQQRAIDVATATTPKNFTRTVGSLGPRTRKKLEERARRLEAERTDFQKLAVAGEEAALGRENQIAVAKAQAGKEMGAKAADQAFQHATKVAKVQAANTILRNFLKKARQGDIAGRGLDAYFATEEGRAVREELKEGARRQLRYESQGQIGEEEAEDRAESLVSGYGDNELVGNVERLIRANEAELEAGEFGMLEEARQIYYRDPNLAPLPPRGSSRASSGAEEDARALGGRVVQ